MNAADAFGVRKGEWVSFAGAGGKTSLMACMAHDLAALGWRVLVTTTTRMGADQAALFRTSIAVEGAASLSGLLQTGSPVLVYRAAQEDKLQGLPSAQIAALANHADVVLIEADGGRKLPFKMPRAHEPVIPAETTLVIPCAALTALGQPLDPSAVFNADGISQAFGAVPGIPLTRQLFAAVLVDAQGGLKAIPEAARVIPFLNAVSDAVIDDARWIARTLIAHARIERVVLGNTHHHPPLVELTRRIGMIVLAAGLSTRMGQPKPLLEWEPGRTILDRILEQATLAGVNHTLVVTGHYAEQVAQIAARHGAATVFNPDYTTGDMLTSLKTGLRALPANIDAALIALGDQPMIDAGVTRQVMHTYARGGVRIAAPSYQMRRGHPILIDKALWGELLDLPAGGAPRDVINRHAAEIVYLNVDDENVLHDLDTPAQYQAARKRAGYSAT
ncbi:MAG: selenium cofactor biosynthesis protein YqeC [bacterium]|nr:selenium cofactor biosynthesis protein YqeC [bacterium]